MPLCVSVVKSSTTATQTTQSEPPLRMRRLSPLLFLFFACTVSTPRPAVHTAPRLAATAVAKRVVLLSLDGLGADALARQSGLTSFASLAASGASARVIPVNPTLTAPTHVSILTGADPQVHGILSNWFHLDGTPPERLTRGLNAEIAVETLVEAARRQGKRVGAVPFPTVDATNSRRSADFGMVWTSSVTEGRILKLRRADFKREWVPPTWTQRPSRRTSFSPIMRARVEWSAPGGPRTDVDLVAYDTSNDRVENYDAYVVEAGDREAAVDARGWFAVAKEQYGSWSKLLDAQPSLEVTLYWGAISRTNAYPDSYRALLDAEVGFWPGAPDEHSDIDAATFAEQLERLSDFLARAQATTIRRMEFDLLLAYQPVVDQALHNFLGYDDDVARRAHAAADRAAAAVGAELDANRDALVVVGDHGLVAAESQVRLGRLLADHGFAPRWRVYATHHIAQFKRFDGPDDTDALVKMLTGTPYFERVERRGSSVIATAFPPLSLSASAEAPLVAEPESYGHHGALNLHRELHTVLFASGLGAPHGNLGEVQQTEIARFVAGLLGIAPPNAAR
jgi:hypothetical protein